MIRKVEGKDFACKMAEIYNSANELYPEDERYPVDADIFHKQIERDENYVYEKNGKFVGFMSYHKHEQYYELTSLYIHLEYQKNGIGEEILCFFEQQIPVGSLMIVKALNTSSWAIQFYIKHKYETATEMQLSNINLEQHSWETILYKYNSSSLTENRLVTTEELKDLHLVLKRLEVETVKEICRFVDTKLDKIYDVYLIKMRDGTRILKQLGERRFDKSKYDTYFTGKGFAVPKILDTVSVDGKDYVLMELVEGLDARNCKETDARKVGVELGKIQSYYLTDGGHTETAEYYWNRYLEKYYEKLKGIFTDIDDVWEKTKQRFYEAPQTLVHDDLLPINVLIEEDQPWIIDWEIAGIYPYFLDLARFAYVFCSIEDQFFVSNASAKAFIDAYYEEMKKNPSFTIDKKQFLYDVAISAFYQYIMFQDYDKSLDEIKDNVDFKFLKEIIQALREER